MARPTLVTHRKFAKLIQKLRSASLKMPRACARGILEAIWDSGYASGDPALGDSESIEGLVDWDGEPGFLTQALLESGFIDRGPDRVFQIHDLYVHAPAYVQARMKREAEREAKGVTLRDIRANSRRGKKKQTKTNEIHLSSNESPPALARARAHALAPAQDGSGSEDPLRFADEPSAPQVELTLVSSSQTPTDPTILVFPCSGDIASWSLFQSKISEWEELFPRVDVLQVCRRALAWSNDRPRERKTAKRMAGWLSGVWISRAQDSGTDQRQQTQQLNVAAPVVDKLVAAAHASNPNPRRQ